MPTYEYACTNPECGHRFDLVQSFSDPSASECPVCGQAVRKVYGAVGVVFKGSGFYRNDSREASQRAGSEKSGASSSADSGSKGESSSTESSAKPETPAKSDKAPAPAAAPSSKPAASTPA
jgi:putative FmdB family regulatory protein